MSTKSNRSSGTQHNQRGVTQGNTLVDPKSGLPVDVIVDGDGKKRLAVDANISVDAGNIDVNVDLDGVGPGGDTVAIVDNVTGNKQKINVDGSIDANVELDAAGGDSVIAVGTEDGTLSGTQHPAKIGSDGNLRVKDEDATAELQNLADKLDDLQTELEQKTEPSDAQNIRAISSGTDSIDVPGVATAANQATTNTELANINTKLANPLPLPTGAASAAKQDEAKTVLESIDSKLTNPLPVSGTVAIGDLNAAKDDVAIAGTEDGTAIGTIRHFVNNRRQQILAAHDRSQAIIYADFGTKDQRVTSIAYTSPTFPGITALKTITYTLVGNRYRRDNIIWSIV